MDIDILIEFGSGQDRKQYRKTVSEGETISLETKGDSDWQMAVTPEEVTQLTDVKDECKECPVCGEKEAQLALHSRKGEKVNLSSVCVSDASADGQEFMMHFHQ